MWFYATVQCITFTPVSRSESIKHYVVLYYLIKKATSSVSLGVVQILAIDWDTHTHNIASLYRCWLHRRGRRMLGAPGQYGPPEGWWTLNCSSGNVPSNSRRSPFGESIWHSSGCSIPLHVVCMTFWSMTTVPNSKWQDGEKKKRRRRKEDEMVEFVQLCRLGPSLGCAPPAGVKVWQTEVLLT